MSAQKSKQEFEMVIASDPGQIQAVEKKTSKIARLTGLKEDERDNVAIAVTEAVANAIFHGNARDKSKKVYIRYSITEQLLIIDIQDEGSGFRPEEIKDPLAPENLLKESGRGVFIVKNLMDDVKFKFTKSGTTVTLIKRLKK